MSTRPTFRIDDKHLTPHGVMRLLEIFESALIEDIGEVSCASDRLDSIHTYTVQHRINGWQIHAQIQNSVKGGYFLREFEVRLTTKHGYTFEVPVVMDDRIQAMAGHIYGLLGRIFERKVRDEEKYVRTYIDAINNPKIPVNPAKIAGGKK